MISPSQTVSPWLPYVDRLYVYDNSIEDAEARLLFRLSDGALAKRYVEELPNWASTILG